MIKTYITSLIMLIYIGVQAQDENRQFDADNYHTVVIANINGSITIEGSTTDEISIKGKKTQWDNDEVSFVYKENDGVLAAYVKTPCNYIDFDQKREDKDDWKYFNWRNNCDWGDHEMSNKIDLTISLPAHMKLYVSTINDGDVTVEKMTGELSVNNINGSITLEGVKDVLHAKTINGDVDLTFTDSPSKEGYYYTLNGDINAFFPEQFSANMTFKSFSGDFYTNIDNIEMMPSIIKKVKNDDGTKYKNQGSVMKVGNGGVELNFETFNGDAIVKTKS